VLERDLRAREEHAHHERVQQELEMTVERQQQQIDELQRQVRVFVPLVSCKTIK
jgi:hypothetical protein